jgi:hypothetical protein
MPQLNHEFAGCGGDAKLRAGGQMYEAPAAKTIWRREEPRRETSSMSVLMDQTRAASDISSPGTTLQVNQSGGQSRRSPRSVRGPRLRPTCCRACRTAVPEFPKGVSL